MSPMWPNNRDRREGGLDWAPAVLVAVLILLIQWIFRPIPVGLFQDTGHYLSGAKALASGKGYALSDWLGQPRIGVYPPGWPAILSVIWRLDPDFPGNLIHHQGLMAVLFGGAAGAAFLVMRRLGVPRVAAFAAAAIWGTALRTHEMAVWLMSDPAFSLLVYGFLLCWLSSKDRSAFRWWWMAGVFVTVGMTIRSAGLGIAMGLGLAGVLAAWRCRGEPRKALGILVAVTVLPLSWLVGWKLWSRGTYGLEDAVRNFHPEGQFLEWYLEQRWLDFMNLAVGRMWGEMFCAVFGRISAVADRYGAVPFLGVRSVVILLNALATAWIVRGFWRLRTRDWAGPVLLVAGTYAFFVAASPIGEAFLYRYLMPVWPLFGVAAWEGRPRIRHLRPIGLGLFALALAANLAWLPRAQRHWQNFFAMDELETATRWIRENTPPGTPIAVDYALPFVHIAAAMDRPLVVDYHHPRWTVSYVGFRQQGYPQAAYSISSDQGYQPSPAEPPAGSTEVFRSVGGHFVVHRLDQVRDAVLLEGIRQAERKRAGGN